MNVVYAGGCCCRDLDCPAWAANIPPEAQISAAVALYTEWRVNGSIVCFATGSLEIEATYVPAPAGQIPGMILSRGNIFWAGSGTSRYLNPDCVTTNIFESWNFSGSAILPSASPTLPTNRIVCDWCQDIDGNLPPASGPLSFLTAVGIASYPFSFQRWNQSGQLLGTFQGTNRATLSARDSNPGYVSSSSFRRHYFHNVFAIGTQFGSYTFKRSALLGTSFMSPCSPVPDLAECDKQGRPLQYGTYTIRSCGGCGVAGPNAVVEYTETQNTTVSCVT